MERRAPMRAWRVVSAAINEQNDSSVRDSGLVGACVVAAGAVAVAAVAGAAPSAAVVAGGVEKQPTASAVVVASAQALEGRGLHEVQAVEGEERRNVAGRVDVEVPAGGCGDEVAAGDGIGERTVQRVAPSDRMVPLGVVDASCEVVVEVLAKVADRMQGVFGCFAVVCPGEVERRTRAVVDQTGTPAPGHKVGGLG
jgi:hypothetical protein